MSALSIVQVRLRLHEKVVQEVDVDVVAMTSNCQLFQAEVEGHVNFRSPTGRDGLLDLKTEIKAGELFFSSTFLNCFGEGLLA